MSPEAMQVRGISALPLVEALRRHGAISRVDPSGDWPPRLPAC